MRLDGKIAFVTGADSGIGRATALTFAREGADVAIHAYGDERGAEQAIDAIRAHGRRAELFEADFADLNNAEGLIDKVVAAMGRLDILVNNAGIGEGAPSSLEMETDAFTRTINVDLIAPFILARDAARHMVSRGSGSIVNITSVHEEIPQPGNPSYCAAKGGLKMVTKTMALELAEHGVRINAIGPGMIATPMTTERINDPVKSEEALNKIPMRRPGEAQEIANVALFLASDEASYVTGSTFFADGGLRQKVGLA
jgi:glucose 1-dehydrogenase